MKANIFFLVPLFLFSILVACKKESATKTPEYTVYTIAAGEHYADKSSYKAITRLSTMKFLARFDSSAIYSTTDPNNQADINKLYGFADNNMTHHAYSARIGWRWNNNRLELLGYVYNDSILNYQPIGNFSFNKDLNCSIAVQGNQYLFTVDGVELQMPRSSMGTSATGYQLYPYFGGDETAPHKIEIRIKDL